MADNEVKKPAVSEASKLEAMDKPLVFVSHDARDAELAEAFAKLLTNVSAGVLKSFRSSDKKGRQGLDFGREWYPDIMSALDKASDVVCLLTARSVDRPWILFEAGVAKGKHNTPVHGIALGIPLLKASTGPFAVFENLEDDEDSLTKLVIQLLGRVAGSEPDRDAVLMQVRAFKERAKGLLEKMGQSGENDHVRQPDNSGIAKMFEEVKVMFREFPILVQSAVTESAQPPRRRRPLRFDPMMLEEIMHGVGGKSDDPSIALLILSSFYRDDFPWLYELGVEAYRASKAGDAKRAGEAVRTFQRVAEFTAHGPLTDEFGPRDKESLMMLMELPHFVEHLTRGLRSPSTKEGKQWRG